ncbi:ComEA family DNA-binding protein [Cellvibrio japonicus]|uniref:Integral membrane protein n=1 Tax=Cellvibrio japonicus (strain Ueda107) TaxID=498211 RepID=B3PII0_CELJU|nr:helix-hairpin-helix domain-containing protein [Cellvibrio japonicus]ACE83064.1 integral membrane protein [Cellvibrio japonicus Ueda107]QEI12580.1 helix-hairpin-helix domain-containing protein [Cellvibrio japonicus]QEI16154.1 helix-hairpin-helix domain-containing protein [Cellvibrio japonicus]QEI19732.1 helix-hairpin-helix domain-containing protein [Cellvibrio japonicus]
MKTFLSLISSVVFFLGVQSIAIASDTQIPANKPVAEQAHSLININTADVATLTQLKGIGTKKAEAIIAWRNANGKFKTIEQLMDVKGIGEATFEANRAKLSI